MEKNLLLQDCIQSDTWGSLEMYMLLTERVLQIDANSRQFNSCGMPVVDVYMKYNQTFIQKSDRLYQGIFETPLDMKFPSQDYPDLTLRLLMAKCPVSKQRSRLR